jgi:hypothetical protein
MTIKEKVEAGIKDAMKAKDPERLSALRMIKAELLLKEKETGKKLEDAQAEDALQKMFRKYKKAKEEYESLGKTDVVQQYERDLKIIESFMAAPMMDEGAIRQELEKLAADMSAVPKDFGKVMKAFMAEHKNADGRVVSSILREILEKT